MKTRITLWGDAETGVVVIIIALASFGEGWCNGYSNSGEIGSYYPICNQDCFQYDWFNWVVLTNANGKETTCTIYWDVNCESEMQSVGPGCTGLNGSAQSMRCYWNC